MERAVAPFTERYASVRRVILMGVALAWAVFWAGRVMPPPDRLPEEAAAALPWVGALLAMSVMWMVYVRKPALAGAEWPDAAGTVGDFLGIGIMLAVAFNLMLPFVIFLPLTCITIGARYDRRAFIAGLIAAVLILGFAGEYAIDGYWTKRPAVAMLAVALIVGMPLTVNRLLTSLREISEEAIKARDTQSRFLAVMSHELRTPLHSIVSATGLIDPMHMRPDERPLLTLVKQNAAVLMSRVDDVLDVAAIDGGSFQLNTGPFEVRSMLDTVRSVIQSMVHAKEVEFDVQVHPTVPQVLIGDARRIEQVLCNLASNAVKYTPRGGSVRVDIGVDQTHDGNVTLRIDVADTGIGIADADKARIFEAFTQVSEGEARAHDGVGLGLHIVRVVSERMGGRLDVASRPGGGTVFTWTLNLPIAGPGLRVSETLEMLELIRRHRLATTARSCLVIDDTPSNLDIMRRILALAGHQVLTASSGEDGLKVLRSTPIDVAFLDIHMPGMSGWDVLREHRQGRGGSQATRIVILSAVTDDESRERAFREGASGYLRKPLDTKALLDGLASIGPMARQAPSLLPAPPVVETTTTKSHVDVMRSIASQADVAVYLHACVDELRETLDDLRKAYAGRDFAEIYAHTHRLKNVFLNGSFTEEATLCTAVMRGAEAHEDNAESIERLANLTEKVILALSREPEFQMIQSVALEARVAG